MLAASVTSSTALRRSGWNLTVHTFGAGSADYCSAELVDEWLQAPNALSIEIFCRDTHLGSSPRLPPLEASPTASSGGIEHSVASMRHLSLVGAGDIVLLPSMRR